MREICFDMGALLNYFVPQFTKKGLHKYLYAKYVRFDRAWYNFIQTHFAHIRTTLSLQVNTCNFMIPSVRDNKFIHIA